MKNITEVIQTLNSSDYVVEKINEANDHVGSLVKRVRALKPSDTRSAILHDLYEISSTLLDAKSIIIFGEVTE